MPEIPNIVQPPLGSIVSFLAVVVFVILAIGAGVYQSSEGMAKKERRRLFSWFSIGISAWLIFGAVLPMSGWLKVQAIPPPTLGFAFTCFVIGTVLAFSKIGARLASLPIYWLIGFHVFRLPLELVLHRWFQVGSIPIQMTFEGYNFDIATGVLALILGLWARFGSPPKLAFWCFNLIGMGLLVTVVSIAITSLPTPFRQFTTEPVLLLPFHFPFSYIVSVAVTGALAMHLILFRKLLGNDTSVDSK